MKSSNDKIFNLLVGADTRSKLVADVSLQRPTSLRMSRMGLNLLAQRTNIDRTIKFMQK